MYDNWIIIGVLVSFAFTELSGLSPGGVIVPIYLALNLNEPRRIAATLVISLLTWLIMVLLSRVVLLYGRRKFVVAVCVSFLLSSAARLIPGIGPFIDVIGCLVPGILARELDRQGPVKTLLSLLIVVCILFMLMQGVGLS